MPLGAFFAALALSVALLALGAALHAPGIILIPAAQPDAPATRRCAECGWIESMEDMPSGADNRAVQIREYTVRMANGSSRVFTSEPGERWRLGERLKVIEGDRVPL